MCGNILESEYVDTAKPVWYCMNCKKHQEADRTQNGVKLLLGCVNDIFRTIKGNPVVVLGAANKLHPILQLIIKNLKVTVMWSFWN